MEKTKFIKELSKILKVSTKKIIETNDFENLDDYDSLSQLSLVLLYDQMKVDKKLISKLSNMHTLSSIISVLEKNKIIQ